MRVFLMVQSVFNGIKDTAMNLKTQIPGSIIPNAADRESMVRVEVIPVNHHIFIVQGTVPNIILSTFQC